jgi:deoxyhypusine synthase
MDVRGYGKESADGRAGWEDSTMGNMFAGHVITGDVENVHTVRTGIEYMTMLADWYTRESEDAKIGFFQIGGGIAGDFPICVVPMLHQDLQRDNVPVWGYFCQISDSTTSYGSYSGAVPNERSRGASSKHRHRSSSSSPTHRSSHR